MAEHTALLQAFAEALRAHDRSAATIKHYLSDLRQFAAWFEQHTGELFSVAAVTEYDVREWRDDLAARMKPATVNRKLAALAALYRWAVETGQVPQDPTRHISGIAQQPTAPKALSSQDLTRILRKAHQGKNRRDIALLELLAATGLRVSETAGLRVGDIELRERSGWATVWQGKGRKQRRVPVHLKARHALWEYLQERGFPPKQPLPRRPDPQAELPLFVSQKGGAMTPYAVWYTVRKYAQQANVAGVSPHTFRHTVATRLVRDPKVDLVTAATFLGHSRLDTTARYSRPSEEDLTEAAKRLE